MVQYLFERAFKELPNLTPQNTRNTTPGRERIIQLLDADGNVLDTIDINEGDDQSWIGFNYSGTIVAQVVDVTPQERKDQEVKDDEDLRVQEGLADRLIAIEERLTALENKE